MWSIFHMMTQEVYLMTSVKNSGERGCWEMCDFPTPGDPHSYGLRNKSKNPYPLRYRIIPDLATARAPGTMKSTALLFLGHDSCLIGNYAISQWVWVHVIMLGEPDFTFLGWLSPLVYIYMLFTPDSDGTHDQCK